ncbi:MAG: response regulator transcription factor [Butyrivibrio sp.]|nr:response regulator transcription factor [Butyrivibrio sp.]
MVDIIVVEDNEEIGTVLMDFLESEGYDVYFSDNGEEALAVFEDEGAKLFVLDVMLPGIDGFEVCRRIREKNNTPIIIVSARGAKEDKLNGLILGADDYLEKPYDIDILIAKINGIMNRRYGGRMIIDGNLKLDRESRRLWVDGKECDINVKEFEILSYMMENRGKVLNKNDLFEKIWGGDSESELQTLTVHIKWLRDKIEKNPKQPTRITTVWGIGYRYEA